VPVCFLNPNTGIVMTNTSKNTSDGQVKQSTRERLVRRIAADHKVSMTDTKKFLNVIMSNIAKSLAEGDRLEFSELGVFSFQEIAAREGRNPRTGEYIQTKPYKKIKFSMSKRMKKAMNPERYPSEQQTPETKKAPAKKAKK